MIRELLESKQLKHLEHAEDSIITGGHEGYKSAATSLWSVYDRMTKQKRPARSIVSIKKDGAPSVVFGMHPTTNRFFVATKSAFNKTPKINYTNDDIERNHGHAPGLVGKLKTALEYLPKIVKHGVYQADVMWDKSSLKDSGNKWSFKPNTITYSTPKQSSAGKKITRGQLGIALHTSYSKNMELEHQPNFSGITYHPDVHFVNTRHSTSKSVMTDEDRRNFAYEMKHANKLADELKPFHGNFGPHSQHLMSYVNATVRAQSSPNSQDYINHLSVAKQKDVTSTRLPLAKNKKEANWNSLISHAHSVHQHINKLFELHKTLQSAKNRLVSGLDKKTEYEHHIGNVPTGPEGYVVRSKNSLFKFNKRHVFNRLNFQGSKDDKFS